MKVNDKAEKEQIENVKNGNLREIIKKLWIVLQN